MKSFDITLYGHLSYDNIFIKFKNITSVGCIGNVWRDIKLYNPLIRVSIQPTAIGESLILVNEEESKRTSKSCLNLHTQKPKLESSVIHHTMYINELHDISFLSDLKGFVTADVCNGSMLNLDSPHLESIDLLFISDEDCTFDLHLLTTRIPNVLLHTKSGSTLYSSGKTTAFTAERVEGVNVLGLGDKFAAYVLCNLINSNFDLSNSIQSSHDRITNELKKI